LRFGSILLRLLRHLDIPVCVIGPHAHPESSQPTLRTILHPISLSGAYERSAALAVALAQYCKAMLTLMHVFDPDRGSQITIGPSALNNLVPGDDLCPPILTTETVGHVVPEVLRVANEIQADMIVLDVHADSFFRSPQGESTAYEIIVSATCPVLVLKVNPELVPVSLVATELAPMFSVA
ncbi:MAG TPA: universal stress protein, partial [Acidobacteriaceae bacterium]|nr:universal stress protein [Acidobacteriaceae bacterium]